MPNDERDPEALATRALPPTPAHDTASTTARIRPQTVLLLAMLIQDVKLGNTDPPITDILCLANGIPIRILRLEVRLVAAACTAGLTLLVGCHDILVTVVLGQPLG